MIGSRTARCLVSPSLVVLLAAFPGSTLVAGGEVSFLRGDANKDQVVDISDPILSLGIFFLGEENPECDDALDANDSGRADLSDAVYVLTFLFAAGASIPAPYPDCGIDPTPDDIGCVSPQEGCNEPVECLGPDELDALINENVPPVTCVAPSGSTIDANGILITVCPADSATPDCDGEGNAGCPVFIDPVEAEIDLVAMEVRGEISGRVDDLPIIADTLLASVRCSLVIPEFSGVAVVPFIAEENDQGQLVIVDVLPGRLEEPAFDLEATGSVLCGLIPAARDSFEANLIAQIEEAANSVLEEFRGQLVGQVLCQD